MIIDIEVFRHDELCECPDCFFANLEYEFISGEHRELIAEVLDKERETTS